MYFHSIIDSPNCGQNVVNLNKLTTDLQSISTTANFNLITPDLCDDGHDSPCVNGQPGGLIERERIPAEVGADYHRLAGVPAGRSVDHQLRRKQLRHRDAVCVRRDI